MSHALSYDAVIAILAELQENTHTIVTVVPSDAEIINVDLDKRQIQIESSSYSKFLSVAHDHYAETIYFKVPRYFDGVDLLRMCCAVEYTNAEGDSRVSPILVKDVTTAPGYIIFGWCIHGDATKKAGILKFAIRFFAVNLEDQKFIYSLRTQQAQGRIMYGVEEADVSEEKLHSAQIYNIVQALQEKSLIYWTNM